MKNKILFSLIVGFAFLSIDLNAQTVYDEKKFCIQKRKTHK